MTWDRRTVAILAITLVALLVTASCSQRASDSEPQNVATEQVDSGDTDPVSGLPWVLEEELPVEAQGTLALIDQGGPFPFPDKDGSTFGNFEGLLPDQPRGYYAEYTVATPGSTDRGARRIVTGEGGEFYWTEDHYASFERIARRQQ